MKRILLGLMMVALSFAQDEKRTDVVTGQVLDAASGEPIRKAFVVLQNRQTGGGQGISTTTDAAGKFRFHSLQPAKYTAVASKDGWVAAERNRMAQEVEVTAAQSAPPLTFKMKKAGVITGRVLDTDGDPVSNVSLTVIPVRKTNSAGRNQGRGWAMTDDRGEYRMRNLEPGRYRVQAMPAEQQNYGRANPQAPEGGGTELTPAPTFYPSVLESSEGAVVQVDAGQEVQGIDIQLQSSRAVRVRGRVNGMPSGPPGRVMISLNPAAAPWMGQGRVVPPQSEKGNFELTGVRAGKYVIMARVGGMDGSMLTGTAEVEVGDSDVDGVTVDLHAPVTVNGRVLVPEGQKLTNVMIVLEPKATAGMFFGTAPARVDAEGAFSFKNVMSGDYRVRLMMSGGGSELPQDLWVAAVMQGSTDVKDSGIRVGTSSNESILVRMETGAPVVNATVRNEKQEPVPMAGVVLVRAGDNRARSRPDMCMTDPAGACKIRALSPGEYQAYAFFPLEGVDFSDPELFAEFQKQAKPVKVTKGETGTVELKPISLE